MNKTSKFLVVVALALGFGTTASAWDGVVTGTISQIDGSNGTFAQRIYLSGTPTLCSSTIDGTWSYLTLADANYKGIMATLLLAYATGKSVTLFFDIGPTGYCQLGYVRVSG